MKIALIGYGKMGKTIESMAGLHEIVLRLDRFNLEELHPDALRIADVAIEFTEPEAAFHNIKACLGAGVPVVSGTTGWHQQLEEAKALTEKLNGTFFYASNYSIGVNIFFALNKQLGIMMNNFPDYQPRLEEVHHTEKKDAPSGTAITLATDLIGVVERKSNWVQEAMHATGELLIESKRINKTPGTHTVTYISEIDDIEIKHTAHSRIGFAKGALLAAEWLKGRKGFFGMSDMLGF